MIYYAISDPTTLDLSRVDRDIERFSQRATMLVYRDKKNKNYSKYAKLFIETSRRYAFDKVLLHSDYRLAHTLKADGIHLTSNQTIDIKDAKSLGLFVVISCHTIDDAKRAEFLGADMITYSPIFDTPNKGKPLGVDAISRLRDEIDIPIIALGGIIEQKEIDAVMSRGASGFASIRYFG